MTTQPDQDKTIDDAELIESAIQTIAHLTHSSNTLQDKLRADAASGECAKSTNLMLIAAADRLDELERQLAEAKLPEFDKRHLEAGQQMQRAASELPEGYEVIICLENGAGTVHLLDEYSDRIELDDVYEDGIATEIADAIDTAKEHAAMKVKP